MDDTTAIMDKPWNFFFWLPTRMIYWSIFVKILHQLTITCASSGPSCYSPCCNQDPVASGDSITLGIALAGDQSLWYNNSDTSSVLLSPCGTQLTHVLGGVGSVATFEPVVDQLSLFLITNSSLLALSENFGQLVSMIVYSTQQGGTILSLPRTFMSPNVNLLSLTLVVEFTKGVISDLIWKDDNCLSCGSTSTVCLNNNCGVSPDVCNLTITTFNNSCNFGVNIAFGGTDKNQKTLQSWYQVANSQRFSLLSIYQSVSASITNAINNMSNSVDGGVPLTLDNRLW